MTAYRHGSRAVGAAFVSPALQRGESRSNYSLRSPVGTPPVPDPRAHVAQGRERRNSNSPFSLKRSCRACLNHRVRRNATKEEVADLIERFLDNRLAYPQEWNDFVDCGERDPDVELYRKRCNQLDPLVNCPDPVDQEAVTELRLMVEELRTSIRKPPLSQ